MATLDYSLERGLPVSIEAERSILGSILLDNGLYDQAAQLKSDDFSLDAHRRIFARMSDLQTLGRPVDMITLAEELDRRKEVEAVGGVAYLSSLIDGVPDRPSIEHYVRIVRNKALLRGLINIAQNAIAESIEHSDEAEEVINRAEQAIFMLSENRIGQGLESPSLHRQGIIRIAGCTVRARAGGHRSAHALHPARQADKRFSALGLDHHRGAAFHGQNLIRHEHRGERRH